ncbi:hypothetical protein [Streptomyces sp. NPDC097610]|uniref:hypothetical protein n=1 Tax=Streptomyces sp. NPDC097610 TaxID=3157227 RepID=UPI00332EE66D
MQGAAELFVSTYVEADDLLRTGEGCGHRAQSGGVRDALMGPMAVVEPPELPQAVEQMALVRNVMPRSVAGGQGCGVSLFLTPMIGRN